MWYVVITRIGHDDELLEPIVIGPFEKADQAEEHMMNSADVDDWCHNEAKSKNYIVDDCYVDDKPDFTSYGVNAPI